MMTYEYVCQDCGKPFEVRATIADYSKGLKPQCTHCGSKKTIRAFTSVNVLTADRSGGPVRAACGPNARPGCCG